MLICSPHNLDSIGKKSTAKLFMIIFGAVLFVLAFCFCSVYLIQENGLDMEDYGFVFLFLMMGFVFFICYIVRKRTLVTRGDSSVYVIDDLNNVKVLCLLDVFNQAGTSFMRIGPVTALYEMYKTGNEMTSFFADRNNVEMLFSSDFINKKSIDITGILDVKTSTGRTVLKCKTRIPNTDRSFTRKLYINNEATNAKELIFRLNQMCENK